MLKFKHNCLLSEYNCMWVNCLILYTFDSANAIHWMISLCYHMLIRLALAYNYLRQNNLNHAKVLVLILKKSLVYISGSNPSNFLISVFVFFFCIPHFLCVSWPRSSPWRSACKSSTPSRVCGKPRPTLVLADLKLLRSSNWKPKDQKCRLIFNEKKIKISWGFTTLRTLCF